MIVGGVQLVISVIKVLCTLLFVTKVMHVQQIQHKSKRVVREHSALLRVNSLRHAQ